ncbi:MAG: heparan-alpha-glucosaminide N-acetyltransferase [Thermoproteota archaeon]
MCPCRYRSVECEKTFGGTELPSDVTQAKPINRIQIIDFIRGMNVILMVLFHYLVTLVSFGLIQIPENFLFWTVFPRSISSLFIFLAGISAYISYKNRKEPFTKKYLKRGLKLLFFAAPITLLTFIFVPRLTIYFGILHFFAFSSFIIPFIISRKKLILPFGLTLILLGVFLHTQKIDFPYLFWLSSAFAPENFIPLEYFPLIPYLGILLLGIYSAQPLVNKAYDIEFEGKVFETLTFIGKRSLAFYLAHQPIIILILTGLGFRLMV